MSVTSTAFFLGVLYGVVLAVACLFAYRVGRDHGMTSPTSSLAVDSSYPQESPARVPTSGRDGNASRRPRTTALADNPPGTPPMRDPNTRGSTSAF